MSKRLMPFGAKKLSRKQGNEHIDAIETRLGLENSRIGLHGGPVMAVLTTAVTLVIVLAAGIFITQYDTDTVVPGTHGAASSQKNYIWGTSFVYNAEYVPLSSVQEIRIPFAYKGELADKITSYDMIGENTGCITDISFEQTELSDSTTIAGYREAVLDMKITYDCPYETVIKISSVAVTVNNTNMELAFPEPLIFFCCDMEDVPAYDTFSGLESAADGKATLYANLYSDADITISDFAFASSDITVEGVGSKKDADGGVSEPSLSETLNADQTKTLYFDISYDIPNIQNSFVNVNMRANTKSYETGDTGVIYIAISNYGIPELITILNQ